SPVTHAAALVLIGTLPPAARRPAPRSHPPAHPALSPRQPARRPARRATPAGPPRAGDRRSFPDPAPEWGQPASVTRPVPSVVPVPALISACRQRRNQPQVLRRCSSASPDNAKEFSDEHQSDRRLRLAVGSAQCGIGEQERVDRLVVLPPVRQP